MKEKSLYVFDRISSLRWIWVWIFLLSSPDCLFFHMYVSLLKEVEGKSIPMGILLNLFPLLVRMRFGNKRKSVFLRRGVSVAFPLFLPMPVSEMLWPLKYSMISGAMSLEYWRNWLKKIGKLVSQVFDIFIWKYGICWNYFSKVILSYPLKLSKFSKL